MPIEPYNTVLWSYFYLVDWNSRFSVRHLFNLVTLAVMRDASLNGQLLVMGALVPTKPAKALMVCHMILIVLCTLTVQSVVGA